MRFTIYGAQFTIKLPVAGYRVLFCTFCILHSAFCITYSQDIHFSQFRASPLNLNPAYTGFFDGDYRFSGIHRNQWRSVTIPYKTFSGAFDMNADAFRSETSRLGAGIVINNDKEGDSDYGLLQSALSLSFIKNIGGDSVHFITGGVQAGFVQQSINYSRLTFDNQYNGDIFDPALGNGETFNSEKFIYADFSAGISWLFRVSERLNFGTGLGIHHLTSPSLTFMDDKASGLNRKIAVDIRSTIGITENIFLLPALLYMNQNEYRELNAGSNVKFVVTRNPGKFLALYAGAWTRIDDAVILSAGVDYNELNIGFSYDINTSDLKRASSNKGAFEVSLAYIIKKVRPLAMNPPCPVY